MDLQHIRSSGFAFTSRSEAGGMRDQIRHTHLMAGCGKRPKGWRLEFCFLTLLYRRFRRLISRWPSCCCSIQSQLIQGLARSGKAEDHIVPQTHQWTVEGLLSVRHFCEATFLEDSQTTEILSVHKGFNVVDAYDALACWWMVLEIEIDEGFQCLCGVASACVVWTWSM